MIAPLHLDGERLAAIHADCPGICDVTPVVG
jgi:hypothetical protein